MSGLRWVWVAGSVCFLGFSGLLVSRPQDETQLPLSHPDCIFFGPQRERFIPEGTAGARSRNPHTLSAITARVTGMIGYVPAGSPTYTLNQSYPDGSIDSYIFADLQAHGITPAPAATDWEFIRRVTLDLTGRIPSPERVLAFVADAAPDKRAKLIGELLAKPEWVDKWTMYFGDLYQNTITKTSTGVVRFAAGRNAFYQWIHDSLTDGKPYSQMATTNRP